MKYKPLLLAFSMILCLLCSINNYAQDSIVFPQPVGLVNDFENVFSVDQKIALTAILEEFMATGRGEIAVVTVAGIAPYDDFAKYTLDLSNYWGVGNADKDNGLIIILSTTLRQVRINTGTGMETTLNDSFCNDVIQQNIIPHFQKAEYYEGVDEALRVIIAKWP